MRNVVISVAGLAHRIFVVYPDFLIVVANQVINNLLKSLNDVLLWLEFLLGAGGELFEGFLEVDDVEELYSS